MGCCQTSMLGPDFQSFPVGNIAKQKDVQDNNKNLLELQDSNSSNNPSPPPIITPFFGKKFSFDESEKHHHEIKVPDIS
ncbi:hypothetical protein SteCoe_18498 [Stentor coeruleus]|uniref:Uncharacterized protein n=1 Tax=Stentor coeruleus TaxID=5963 RepID=A0A1R2BWR2_9CILI|nr:hypothetical protein SteCoe_18498 [Stentor coeruleus]